MKRVALMTWFQHDNYGTALQAVATSRVITDMGHEIKVINYNSKGFDRLTRLDKIKNPVLVKEKIISSIENKKYCRNEDTERKEAFEKFRNTHLKMTRNLQTLSELNLLNEEYDAFICGSDQIWSLREFNPKYYLNYVAVKEKKIAYAPSFGREEVYNRFTEKRVSECVKAFQHLSVREKQGAKLIRRICDRKAGVFVDPTLLLTKEEWSDYTEEFRTPKSYLLCYFLGDNKKHWEHIAALSKKLDLEVVVIPIHRKDYDRGYHSPKGIGPGEFLTLVKNAAIVCTDSYHGTIFSVIYEKPFITYKRFVDYNAESQNSRIYHLLKLLKLKDRLYTEANFDLNKALSIDFDHVKKVIQAEKKKALQYITESLQAAFTAEYDRYAYEITNTCCGCSVCVNVCSYQAIKIEQNNYGFYEAKVDADKCIKCGLCRKVCAFNGEKGKDFNPEESKLYMLRSKSLATLSSSTSGGAAHEIAMLLNSNGFDATGCIYDTETNLAKHIVVHAGNTKSLSGFQGSKYIQSNMEEALKEILQADRAVIFGTPCQIAGISNLLTLKGIRDKFILVDLICHGVPSYLLWKKYLEEIGKKYGVGDHPEVQFRYKSKGWKEKYIYINQGKTEYLKKNTSDLFYRFFELQSCYMTSCYECNYRTSSKADIRIGDYWGNKYDKYKTSGASMVITHTQSGQNILTALKEQERIELVMEDLDDYWSIQYPENPVKPLCYEEFLSDLKDSEESLAHLMVKYFRKEDFERKLSYDYREIKNIMKLYK